MLVLSTKTKESAVREVRWRQASAGITKLPERPPCFSTKCTPAISMLRSTALHMSYIVSSATCTAARASISTPVGPTVSTVAVQAMPVVPGCFKPAASNSTATRVSASGWHSGIRSLVFFAAWMPAIRAMPSTSPFLAVPASMMASVAGCISMRPVATAMRWVAGLAPTSTMWAWPWASKWVSVVGSGLDMELAISW